MILYRITNSLYKDDISGTGAKLNGARWNKTGYPLLYTSEHISLCVLEMLVNITLEESQLKYYLLHIDLPGDVPVTTISGKKLKKNWQDDTGYTQFMGTGFVQNNDSLILKVPSAVITEEHNFLINPLHKNFAKVKIAKAVPFKFDKRLFEF